MKKLGFYEKVAVLASDNFPEHVGRQGVVLGISEDETKVYAYSVSFPGQPECLTFSPHELQGSGEFVSRSEFYNDEDRIRVTVVDGKGFLSKE